MRGRSLLERLLYGIAALAVLVLGFFFLAAALVAGALLAGAILIRYWWLNRRMRKATDAEIITTEYTVIERESPPAPRLPTRQ